MLGRAKTAIAELYAYREVLWNLLSRDLKLKYKNTALGYVWSLLNPVLQLAILALVFSHVVRWSVRDYTLYLFSGMIVWMFFSNAILMASYSFIENEHFIRKIYLPKALFPLSKICFRGVDFLFSLVALSLIGAVLGFPLRPTVALLPFAIVLLVAFTLGLSLLGSVLTVYFRDMQYLINVVLQMLYFATPILYPIEAIPERYRWILQMNPLFTQVSLFQKLIYEGVYPTALEWTVSGSVALGALLAGFIVLMAREEDLVFRL